MRIGWVRPQDVALILRLMPMLSSCTWLVIKPYIEDYIKNSQNSNDEFKIYSVASFEVDKKTLRTFFTEIVLPTCDMYAYYALSTTIIPAMGVVSKLNFFFKNKWILATTPVILRGISIGLELSNYNNRHLSTIKDMSLRASEFTAWYYFYNLGLQNRIPYKNLLGLTNKLLAIYSIRVLDRLEDRYLKNDNGAVFDHSFLILPLTKNPVTTICKIPVDLLSRKAVVKYPLETVCNFLGEIFYVQTEEYMQNSRSLLDSSLFDIKNPQFKYLLAKSTWKTTHQFFEKRAIKFDDQVILDTPLGYRVMAVFFPRSYITSMLKNFFHVKEDTSEYLDPDLVNLLRLDKGKINSMPDLLSNINNKGSCPSLETLKIHLLNVTDNLQGYEGNIDAIMPCAAQQFYHQKQDLLANNSPACPKIFHDTLKLYLNEAANFCIAEAQPKTQAEASLGSVTTIIGVAKKAFDCLHELVPW